MTKDIQYKPGDISNDSDRSKQGGFPTGGKGLMELQQSTFLMIPVLGRGREQGRQFITTTSTALISVALTRKASNWRCALSWDSRTLQAQPQLFRSTVTQVALRFGGKSPALQGEDYLCLCVCVRCVHACVYMHECECGMCACMCMCMCEYGVYACTCMHVCVSVVCVHVCASVVYVHVCGCMCV